jgi:hypothetical protein
MRSRCEDGKKGREGRKDGCMSKTTAGKGKEYLAT